MLFKRFYTFVISFQLYCFHFTLANEPVCSKFDYEEKLIEKMVRTEIKVETMVNEMKVTQERVMDTLGVISETVKDFTERFETLRKNNTAELLGSSKSIEKKINVFERLIQATQMNLSKEMENHRKNFIELQGNLERPSVGFYVNHLTDVNLNTADEVLVFDSIITNEGSGYDTSTGIFTAPVRGLYHLAVHICTQSGKYSYIGIVHADKVISKTYNSGSGSYICSSMTAVVRVNSGERVWVQSFYGGSTRQLFQNSDMINSFSGNLINI